MHHHSSLGGRAKAGGGCAGATPMVSCPANQLVAGGQHLPVPWTESRKGTMGFYNFCLFLPGASPSRFSAIFGGFHTNPQELMTDFYHSFYPTSPKLLPRHILWPRHGSNCGGSLVQRSISRTCFQTFSL